MGDTGEINYHMCFSDGKAGWGIITSLRYWYRSPKSNDSLCSKYITVFPIRAHCFQGFFIKKGGENWIRNIKVKIALQLN